MDFTPAEEMERLGRRRVDTAERHKKQNLSRARIPHHQTPHPIHHLDISTAADSLRPDDFNIRIDSTIFDRTWQSNRNQLESMPGDETSILPRFSPMTGAFAGALGNISNTSDRIFVPQNDEASIRETRSRHSLLKRTAEQAFPEATKSLVSWREPAPSTDSHVRHRKLCKAQDGMLRGDKGTVDADGHVATKVGKGEAEGVEGVVGGGEVPSANCDASVRRRRRPRGRSQA
ncbi:hypothetical protein DV736_g2349, partial [Chaetothyriales sp. CBS 134916]